MTQPQEIHVNDYFNVALSTVKAMFRFNENSTTRLTGFDTHLTFEDLASMTVERVLRAKPEVVSASYIRVAARNTCFDERKRRSVIDSVTVEEDDDSDILIEHKIPSDIHDHIGDLTDRLSLTLSKTSGSVLELIIEGHNHSDIAKILEISATTVQTHVNTIKAKIEDL